MKRITLTLLITMMVLLGIVPVAGAANANDTVTINVNNQSSFEYSMLFLNGTTLVKGGSAHALGWVSFTGPAGVYEYFIDRDDGIASWHGYVNAYRGAEFTITDDSTGTPVLSMITTSSSSSSSSSPSPATSYVVEPGDRLVDIAQSMSVTTQFLAAANHLGTGDAITIGQVLYSDRWVVQAGETLSQIASKSGVSANVLAPANNLPNMNFISVGQTLFFP